MNALHLAVALATPLSLSSCAPYATVSSVDPRLPSAAYEFVSSFAMGGIGTRQDGRPPLAVMGQFLEIAQSAQRRLERDPGNITAREAYNFAVARVVNLIAKSDATPWAQPLRVPGPHGVFILTHPSDSDPQRNPALYDLTPADQLRIKGPYVLEHKRREGIGAPVVAVERGLNNHPQRDHTMARIYYGVTALIHFKGQSAVLTFEDPINMDRVMLAGHSLPLAADFTAPTAVLLAQQNPRKVEIDSLLHPEKYAARAQIVRCEPYDPNKRVVLIIHGLKDTPATWVPMFNHLILDEQLRRNYQLWFYGYPTGYPYSYSAAILRRELDDIERRLPLHKKMVVIGHSMGGCISRLLITDTEDRVWREMFQKTPGETSLSPETKELLSEVLIFRHRPEIGRVIFIAAPLRGSDLARNGVGRIGSMLVRTPHMLSSAGRDALPHISFQGDEMRLKDAPNSVDSLAPNDLFTLAIQRIPVTSGIPHHVICGDRGKGGNKDKTQPAMSDGVVPYWSSHMDTAKTELIVPSGHGAHQNPQAIAEVERILKLNLRE